MGGELTRRTILRVGGGAMVGTSIAGCDLLSTEPADTGSDASSDGRPGGREAPELAGRVKSGALPRLEQRLPARPLAVEPVYEPGRYGGVWNTTLLGPSDVAWLNRTIGYDNLVRWSLDWTSIVPNVAESFEINDGGAEYVFRLREGMKWSDGEPFTAADIMFFYEDVLLDQRLTPSMPDWLTAGQENVHIEARNKYTVVFSFAEPNAFFLPTLATPNGNAFTVHPRHYFAKYHEAHNTDIDQLVKENDASDWVELFTLNGGGIGGSRWQNADMPSLHAWVLTGSLGDEQRLIAERNPYYWKTDPNGRQLPFIDQVAYDIANSEDAILLKASNGELDMHMRHINSLQNKPVLARNRELGTYRFFDTVPAEMNVCVISLNLTHKNPLLREIFQNRDFRIGLSHAINRSELIKTVYQGQGEPWQGAPRPESKYFDEQLAKQYTNYDTDTANDHLDRSGMVERTSDGIRLGPTGEPIAFTIEFFTGLFPDWPDALELIRQYWRAVGIDLRLKSEDRSLWAERLAANEHDATVFTGVGGWSSELLLNPAYYFPYGGNSYFAPSWVSWNASGGSDGEAPSEAAIRQMSLYDEMRRTPAAAEQDELMTEILRIARDEFYVIGISLTPPGYGIARTDFRNVVDPMPDAWLYPSPAATYPEQYFIA